MANPNDKAQRLKAVLIYLGLGLAVFALVSGWDYVGLRLWGKN